MCPPGVDQTTRSAQRWAVMCPRLKQQHGFDQGDHYREYNRGPVCCSENGWSVWAKLAKPDPLADNFARADEMVQGNSGSIMSVKRKADGDVSAASNARKKFATNSTLVCHDDAIKSSDVVISSQKANRPLSALERLPSELRRLILEELHASDLIYLAQTSTTLLSSVLPHINSSLTKVYGLWAKQEIAVTGTYLTKLPPAFVKDGLAYHAVEMPHLIDGSEPPKRTTYGRGTPYRNRMCPARQMNWRAISNFEDVAYRKPGWQGKPTRLTGIQMWRSASNDIRDRDFWANGISVRVIDQINNTIIGKDLFPSSAGWILRDVDAKEMIRCQVRTNAEENSLEGWINLEQDEDIRLDEVLLKRILWSDDVNLSDTRAGNRFEIVSERMHDLEGGNWKDVTPEAVTQAKS